MLPSGTEDDLEYYVRECGNILGVAQKLDGESQSAKHVLSFIFDRIVEFKKFNQVKLFSTKVNMPELKMSVWSDGRSFIRNNNILQIVTDSPIENVQ